MPIYIDMSILQDRVSTILGMEGIWHADSADTCWERGMGRSCSKNEFDLQIRLISKETANSDSVQTALEKRDKSWKVGTATEIQPPPQATTSRAPSSSPPSQPTPSPPSPGSQTAPTSTFRRLAPQRAHYPRLHRDQCWVITSALMKKFAARSDEPDAWVEIVNNAHVARLLEKNDAVVGVEYEVASGSRVQGKGNIVRATGGYAANSSAPVSLPATAPTSSRSPRQTATTQWATACNLRSRAARPSETSRRCRSFIDPAHPAAVTSLFLAARHERASRPACDGGEAMQRVEGAVRLVLGERVVEEVKKEASLSKNLMKRYPDTAAFAEDTGITLGNVLSTFAICGKDGYVPSIIPTYLRAFIP
ncbi:hypothetical protein C8R45DRAFT_1081505 [Mycena sanguinolenta]|nr:hypothetical protein C8R45DRAFT_1081505 [Mycena sanguinolenta]